MHAVAVEFDFVEPLIAVRRRVDELSQLRPDPLGQSSRTSAWPARYWGGQAQSPKGLQRRSIGLLGLERLRRAAIAVGRQFR